MKKKVLIIDLEFIDGYSFLVKRKEMSNDSFQLVTNYKKALLTIQSVKFDIAFITSKKSTDQAVELTHLLGYQNIPFFVLNSSHPDFLKLFSNNLYISAFSKEPTKDLLSKNVSREPSSSLYPPSHLVVYDGSKLFKLNYDKITYIKAESQYICIHTVAQTVIVRQSLKKLLTVLPKFFVKCNKACAVNVNMISLISNQNVVMKILHKSITLPVSRTYKNAIISAVSLF